jgi:hypothetical protein
MTKPTLMLALLIVASGSMATCASAVTAEVARKCEALTHKAYPPRVIGNPAAGSTKGTGAAAQAYFSNCVRNGGKVDDAQSTTPK